MQPSALKRVTLGKTGEDLAREFYKRHGYEIVGQNVRLWRQEVDLIVSKSGETVFVEVKTRSGNKFGEPEEAITSRKIKSIERAMVYYLKQHPQITKMRFDVIAVSFTNLGEPVLKHFPSVGEGAALAFL